MLERIATDLAHFFYANSGTEYDDGDVEIYSYGLQMFLSSVLEVSFVAILGICVGRFFETAAFFIGFIPLRLYAGGCHARTHLRCFLVLLVIYSTFLSVLYAIPVPLANYFSIAFVCLSALSVLTLAPLADVNKPIGPIRRREYRQKSVVIYSVQAIFIVGISLTGLLPYIALSLAIGQLSAAGSLVAAKITNPAK